MASEAPSVPASELAAERRHLTILFCDLVGSVTLAAQVDPEEWRATVAGYQRAASEAISRFGGEVVRYVGDGIMAFFGYPVAHDNDAERAARAGLAILDAIAKLNDQPEHTKLAVRIGIDSGRVVVGKGEGQAVDAFGDTANIAARVQAAADPDTVVVTGETHRLISGLFVVEQRGAQALKGIERPVQLYRVVRPGGMQGRFKAAAAAGGLTPFVGRDDELRSLVNRWARAVEGEGQVVTIIGEPGIGKSRLVLEFRERIAGERHTWLEGSTAAFFQNTPFYATAEMLRQSLDWHSNQNNERRLAALEGSLKATGVKIDGAVRLIASLLELPLADKYPPLSIPPQQQRKRLLATLVAWMMGAAKKQPLVIATEDLHWADPSTLEVTQLLVEQGATAPLMLICTARPEFRAPWSMRAHHMQITLNRLSARNVHTMISEVAAQKALSDETIAAVVERTGGVPLFVEELTRAVLESGEDKLSGDAIPATIHDSLMARLDRLGAAKEVIQVGAVIGSEFSYELLHAVHRVPEPELQTALGQLADAELLYVQGLAPNANYQFKHALIRDAAYEAMLKSQRRSLHEQIAQIMEERFPEIATVKPELLAYHCTEARRVEQAERYWRRAGRKAVERSANFEAITQFRKALELIEGLPASTETVLEEVKARIALTTPLMATKGYTAPEVEQECNRALALCQQIGDTPYLFTVLGGLNSIYFNRSDLEISLELGKRMLRLAETWREPRSLLWAHYGLGFTLASQGKLRLARDHLQKCIALYDPAKGGSYGFVQDPGPTATAMLAQVVYLLGYPDQAMNQIQLALGLARSLSHPFTLAWVLGFAGDLYWRRGEKLASQEYWRERASISSEHGFTPLLQSASFSLGLALAAQEGGENGTAKMRDFYARYSSIDTLPFQDKARWLGLLALAQGKAGRIDEALVTIDEALALAKKTKKPKDICDLNIFKGQLLLMKNPDSLRKAKQCFGTAIGIARATHAKSDELTAVIEMAKLLLQQGRGQQGRAMLAEIYNWFTEGFDTADLKDAKALLDELGS